MQSYNLPPKFTELVTGFQSVLRCPLTPVVSSHFSIEIGMLLTWCKHCRPGGSCNTVVISCLCANQVIPVHTIAPLVECCAC